MYTKMFLNLANINISKTQCKIQGPTLLVKKKKFIIPFSHLESCCSVLIGWWSPRVRKMAKSLPMKSADVPEYSSPSTDYKFLPEINSYLCSECLLPGGDKSCDQTHQAGVTLKASWGHRGFSLCHSQIGRPVGIYYPVVKGGQSLTWGQWKPHISPVEGTFIAHVLSYNIFSL